MTATGKPGPARGPVFFQASRSGCQTSRRGARLQWRRQVVTPTELRNAETVALQPAAVLHRAVVIDDEAVERLSRILVQQIDEAAVGGIRPDRAVVEDGLALGGVLAQHLGYGPGIAREQESAGQRDAVAEPGLHVPDLEDPEPQRIQPETPADRDELECVPEIRAALGPDKGIACYAFLQPRHDSRRDEQPHQRSSAVGGKRCCRM